MTAAINNPYTLSFMDSHRVVLLDEGPSCATVGSTRRLPQSLKRVLQAYHCCPIKTELLDEIELRLRIQRQTVSLSPTATERRTSVVTLSDTSREAPAVNLVNSLLTEAARLRASDLHVASHGDRIVVRARIDGVIRDFATYDVAHFRSLAARLKILAGLNGSERRRPQDGRFTAQLEDDTFDVRLSSIPTASGESLALRLFPQTADSLQLSQLGMDRVQLDTLGGAISRTSGLILVSGPTGSGKTTTLHACIRSLDRSRRRIITIEDPVEYRLPGIEQVQINESAGLTFESTFRRVLRHDPDVIMVGEVRDRETALLAVRATLTGHLVLSTLHAESALGTIHRLIDLGADCRLLRIMPVLLMAQRLVRTVCADCGEPRSPTPEERAWLQSKGSLPPAGLAHGTGCRRCGTTGYLGRTGIFELLHGTGIDWALHSSNGEPLVQSGVQKICSGTTTVEEVVWATGG